MCGLSFYIKGNSEITVSDFLNFNRKIEHRGPDDEGFAFILSNSKNINEFKSDHTVILNNSINEFQDISENLNSKIDLAFGHRRLAIIDLSAFGHMPMYDYSRRYIIIFNGEIYNYLELRDELLIKGYKFNTETDTEVILNAFHEWGEKCINKFSGMWSFVIYDTETDYLFISRDRFGIKPLYYWLDADNSIYFASEIKQFTVLPNWRAVMNHNMVLDFLTYGLTDHTNETMFKGVYSFPPSHFIYEKRSLLQSQFQLKKYYNLNSVKPLSNISYSNAVKSFRKIFDKSMNLHLRSDVKIGYALSGGIDSSSIVCWVNNYSKNGGDLDLQSTYSACSKYAKFDEREWIDYVLNNVNVNPNFYYSEISEIESEMIEVLRIMDEPVQSQSAYLGKNIFKLAHEDGVKVLLNGQGADEYLGGYGQFEASLFISKYKFKDFFFNPFAILKELKFLIPNFFYKQKRNLFLNYSNLKNTNKKHPYQKLKYNSIIKDKIVDYFLFKDPLPRYLRYEDRNSMAYSVEARVPFLNHNLVEFCQSLPAKFMQNNQVRKSILRDAVKDVLPSEIYNRMDKKGFITPEEQWLKFENPEIFRIMLKKSISYSKGIITEQILDYLDDVINEKVQFDYTYWRYIQFGYWMKEYSVDLE